MKKLAKGGVYVKLNGNQPVQKVAGAPKGVGPTKSTKIKDAQAKAGSKGVGTTKSQKATVSPASKKKSIK